MRKKQKNLSQKAGTRHAEKTSLNPDKKKLSLLEEKYGKLEQMYGEALENLSETEHGESIEKLLKNEAYAFLLSESLIDKFLDFRDSYRRTKAQEAYWRAVSEADLDGYWLELC